VVNDDNKPYWDAVKEHRLEVPRCTTCGWYYNRWKLICSNCGGESFAWTQVSGKGTIHKYSIVYQTTVTGFQDEIPYVVVNVSLDEQPECIITTNLLGVDQSEFDNLTVGLPVQLEFEDRPKATVPQFRLVR
jgi:uncharacterized OB-fold protein